MDIRLIRAQEIGAGDIERWRALAADATEPNPFVEPDFVLPAIAHLLDAPKALIVAEHDGVWQACLPIAPGRWHRLLPVLSAWRGLYGLLGTPLVARGGEPAAVAVLREASVRAGGRAVLLERASADGPLAEQLATDDLGAHRLADRAEEERAVLHRHADGEYLGHMKTRHLREFKRQRRRLGEHAGGEVAVADRAGDEDAVAEFLRLERGGWKGRSETALASHDADMHFFREICERFHASRRLQLLELRAGDRVVAMKCNILAAPGSFAFKIAFDEEFARFSPGIQLELENIRHFHSTALEWMDSCADADNAMINRLWTGRRRLQTSLYARRSVLGAARIGLLKAGLRLRGRTE